ncbi:hypothetical protein HK102_013710 [Quaeritorhiza haematococci]|nr:hypothetical protein HK102_013710 [Quaeritorhiza haematococci]
MSYEYPVTRPPVNIVNAFTDYVSKFPKYDSLDYTATTIIFRSRTALTREEVTSLVAYVNAFPNPTSFLELERIDNFPNQSMETNASELTVVSTFINSPASTTTTTTSTTSTSTSTSPRVLLDALKTVVQFRVPDSFSGGALTLRFQIFDRSRRIIMADRVLNVGSILTSKPGPQTVYQSVMISDLASNAVSYDTVWQLHLAVSSPTVYVSLHGLQLFFYTRHTA